jgi:hypothetical protein
LKNLEKPEKPPKTHKITTRSGKPCKNTLPRFILKSGVIHLIIFHKTTLKPLFAKFPPSEIFMRPKLYKTL